ncbi:YkuS family protein [Paenibacillus sp. J2TS4]|uniref:YkuS family protein n=1 Tax=Paenibacillus sp. J2TS4 TaxID=2807194 RepID=UPI001AFFECBA|nr:YkuS family protein [Paenibacillus sp. J2TS4]GIP36153.1 UPF0180 protein [Paenibacillus sp. J2TS4]
MARIAVENTLGDVKNALQNSGHEVMHLDENSVQNCDCCVISGLDQNVMGIAVPETQASVINAQGMTAEEVVNQVNQRINQ